MISQPARSTFDPGCDEQGAAAFVDRHQAGLWRWLRMLGCESASAEEHCQDALLAALHEGVHRWADADAGRWLRAAARNLFLMELRTRRRRPPVAPLDAAEAAWGRLRADRDGGRAALAALDRCLETLTDREHELVMGRYAEQRGRQDMARAMGVGEAGVKQALRRVRAKLRACIVRRLEGE